MMMKTLSILGLLALGGCSMISGGKADTTDIGGGGGGGEAARTPADNMHDAPTFHVGESLSGPAECHASRYLIVDAPAGEAFQIDVAISGPEGSCVDVSYLNSNGGSQNGGQMFGELCENKTLDVVGLEGGAYVQISESGACKGASYELTFH
jgi:hypothetical protein